jgi:plastocyanin
MPSRPTSWRSIRHGTGQPESTPGRARGRPGVVVLATLAGILAGCEAGGAGATIQLDTAEVQLERGASVHDITISGEASADSLAPARVSARVGDALRFTTDDHRTHAMGFDADRLDPQIRDYLERTNQLRGPPLVDRGDAWIVVLDAAPPGVYPFLCRVHDARGVLRVVADS